MKSTNILKQKSICKSFELKVNDEKYFAFLALPVYPFLERVKVIHHGFYELLVYFRPRVKKKVATEPLVIRITKKQIYLINLWCLPLCVKIRKVTNVA